MNGGRLRGVPCETAGAPSPFASELSSIGSATCDAWMLAFPGDRRAGCSAYWSFSIMATRLTSRCLARSSSASLAAHALHLNTAQLHQTSVAPRRQLQPPAAGRTNEPLAQDFADLGLLNLEWVRRERVKRALQYRFQDREVRYVSGLRSSGRSRGHLE